MKANKFKLMLAAALAVASAPALALTWTEGYGAATSYQAAYNIARADAADLCYELGGTPGSQTNVIGTQNLGGGYTEVVVSRICTGV